MNNVKVIDRSTKNRVVSNIIKLRKSRGLSQADLARDLKINRERICAIEKGQIPSLETAAKLSKALGVSLDDLVWKDL